VIAWIIPEISSFMLVVHPLQSRVVGPFPSTGCLVPQPFAAEGNRSYLEFWAITGGPRYPGYITLTRLHIERRFWVSTCQLYI
jgi:hypothetical protein